MIKNALKFLALVTYIWLPLGFEDTVITPAIISVVGLQMYIIISIILIYLLYRWIEGRTLYDKLQVVKREIKIFLKSLTR